MSNEKCSKSISRRLADSNFIQALFVWVEGIDISGKPYPVLLYKELFCQMVTGDFVYSKPRT